VPYNCDQIVYSSCFMDFLCFLPSYYVKIEPWHIRDTIKPFLWEVWGANKRLQEMMAQMVKEQGGTVRAMSHGYCIKNLAMIGQAGMFALQFGGTTPLENSRCTQRYRTDQVGELWGLP
jgi:hypothetical protein